MPMDTRQLADLEAGLSDEQLVDVRFGRSRFLRNAGLALFGAAAGVFAGPTRQAEAAPPPGCRGAPECPTCNGCSCGDCCRKAYTCKGTASPGSSSNLAAWAAVHMSWATCE